MQVILDKDAVEAMVQKAVFDSLTPEKREALITGAIKQIFEERNQYTRRTVVDDLFAEALRGFVAEEIKKLMATSDLKERIERLTMAAIVKVFADPDRVEKTVERMASALLQGFER